LLQSCAEPKQYAASCQRSPVLFAELLTEWNDTGQRPPRSTKDAAISFGASLRCWGHSAFDAGAAAQ